MDRLSRFGMGTSGLRQLRESNRFFYKGATELLQKKGLEARNYRRGALPGFFPAVIAARARSRAGMFSPIQRSARVRFR